MFRLTLRGLATYIAFVGLTLALTRVELEAGIAALVAAAALAYRIVPTRTWLFAAQTGIYGAILASLLLDLYVWIRYGDPPWRARNPEGVHFKLRALAAAAQLGALAGGTVGIFLARRRATE